MHEPHVVLAVVRDPEHGWMSVRTGASLASRRGGRLEVLIVVDPLPITDTFLPSGSLGEVYGQAVAQALERRAAEFVEKAGAPDTTISVGQGHPSEAIGEKALELDAGLVVLGARSHGLFRSMAATAAETILHIASCPVLVTPEPRERPYARILAGLDLMSHRRGVVRSAAELARMEGAALRVVHVREVVPMVEDLGLFDDEAIRRSAEDQLRAILSEEALPEPVEHSAVVRHGQAGHEILEEVGEWGADLVVVGSRGEGVLKRLLLMGTSARHILHHNRAATLVVPCGEGRGKDD